MKTQKVNITIEFCIFELAYVPNFKINLQFLFFWTKFAQKQYFHFETEKVNTTIEFRMLELV